jgi:hypothetical protein
MSAHRHYRMLPYGMPRESLDLMAIFLPRLSAMAA